MAKRRRGHGLFSQEGVLARLKANSDFTEKINDIVDCVKAKELQLSQIVDNRSEIGEEAIIFILSCKLSTKALLTLAKAVMHVPTSYQQTGYKDHQNLRLYAIAVIMEKAGFVIEKTDLSNYVTLVETCCPSLRTVSVDKEFMDVLWKATKEEGFNFNVMMAPPVQECSTCHERLTTNNKSSKATLFTLKGPIPVTKLRLRCRECSIQYGICTYKDKSGEHLYSRSHRPQVVEVSNVCYVDMALYRWIPSLGNHCWVSFSGFSTAYNEVFVSEINHFSFALKDTDGYDTQDIETIELVPTNESDETDETNMPADVESVDDEKGVCLGELTAKAVGKAFWKEEVHCELAELCLDEKWTFKEAAGHLCGKYDDAMEHADKYRSHNLYAHKCSDLCKKKGCGSFYVADGNWKLRHAHCMWKVPVNIEGFGNINYPAICPLTPVRGKAFCNAHVAVAEQQSVKTDLKEFLKSCGLDEEQHETEGMVLRSFDKVDKQLDKLSNEHETGPANATTFQGTLDFLQKDPTFVDDDSSEHKVTCNKDTGGKKVLQCWSRGSMWIVSGGGNIEYFQPLYRSESPTQAFVIFISWLLLKFSPILENGSSKEDVSKVVKSTVLSYDNMCHVDNMKLAKLNLPLPAPLNTVWKDVGKVIDRLHLRNHKDARCKKNYDPDGKIPKDFNSMAAEQTFVWASRMKKIVCAMPRLHHFFYLHRSIKRRNAYTQRCYEQNKLPILPKLSKEHYSRSKK